MMRICSWCQRKLSSGTIEDDSGRVSHGICLECSAINKFYHSEDLSDLPRDYIDSLPNGIIVLDSDDKIVEFNLYEKNRSQYSDEDVIGKNFFHQVAPCTGVKEFEGKLNDMREAGEDDQLDFKFIFNHERFYAKVKIVMMNICINYSRIRV